jgi:hypothetical protein
MPAVLLGEWRYSNGVLCCGSLRIAYESIDTNPSDAFKDELFKWVCEKLNQATKGETSDASKNQIEQERERLSDREIYGDRRDWTSLEEIDAELALEARFAKADEGRSSGPGETVSAAVAESGSGVASAGDSASV